MARPARTVHALPAPTHLRRLALLLGVGTSLVTSTAAAEDALAAPPACARLAPVRVFGVGEPGEELERLAQLTETAPLRSLLFRRAATGDFALCTDGALPVDVRPVAPPRAEQLELGLLPFGLRNALNTGYPDERNDGAMWAGRGLSAELHGGVSLRWKWFSAALAPSVAYQQNRAFPYPAELGDGRQIQLLSPGHSIDLPVRFGSRPFWTFDPGQSYLQAEAWNVSAGVSTENLWWGPGVRNALLMTNTAPGFAHAFIGTARPVDVWLGWLEAQVLWGLLDESPVFDDDPSNDRRALVALTAGFEPRFMPGLYLGLARVYVEGMQAGKLSAADLVSPLFQSFLKKDLATEENPLGNSADNQLVSAFARWAIPQQHAELYFEWGRDDHNWDLVDLAMEPWHSQAYLLGGQKAFPLGGHWLRVQGELIELGERPAGRARPTPVFYTHSALRQGYTHRGQMLGAALGPGGEGAYVALDLFGSNGRSGLFFERNVRNEPVFYARGGDERSHDLELTAGARQSFSWKAFDAELGLSASRRWNQYFGPMALNWSGQLSVTWYPGRERAPVLPAAQR